MGTVYEAIDPASGLRVAVKALHLHLANDDTIRRRFDAEIETLKKLSHPCIVHMLSWGEQEGLPWFAMEYVQGLTLEALLRSGKRFTWQDTVTISQEVVKALRAAHDKGVVHRDLKPANLMFPPAEGGKFHVKLADFGIAKLFGETGLTRAGSVIGTPEYMAPEQAAGLHVDRRADLYSLGLVMFAMLSGKPPFRGVVAEVLESQRSREPPRITEVVPDVPKPLADLIHQLLDKSPGRRPNNSTVVANLLADVASAASKARRPFAASVAMPKVPEGMPTTIVTDAHGQAVDSSDARSKTSSSSSKGGPSTFTTREEDARAARIEREREARANKPKWWLATGMAMTIISGVLAGGCLLLKPVVFPSADAVHARVLKIIDDPNSLEDECSWITYFLQHFPNDQRADGLRQIAREIGIDRLQKQMRRSILKLRLGFKAKPKASVDKLQDMYLDALHFWLVKKDLKSAAETFDRIVATPNVAGPIVEASITPCDIAENPDPSTWRELARRQREIIGPILDAEDAEAKGEVLADTKRARWMLTRAAELQQKIDDPATHVTQRVISNVQRHELLEQVVDTYADEPHCAEQVDEARRLLAADR
jgi:serine/threonine protein kinase